MGLPNRVVSSVTTAVSGAISDAIWDEAKSGHTTVGTYGGDMVVRVVKTLTFTGATTLGEIGAVPLFTTTGTVQIISIVPTCTTLLASAGAGNVSLGVTANTALFIAATVATEIDAAELWVDTAPDANGVAVPAALKDIVIADNDEIILTVDTGDVTSGVITFVVEYVPLTSGSSVAGV